MPQAHHQPKGLLCSAELPRTWIMAVDEGVDIRAEFVDLPLLVAFDAALDHNIASMARFSVQSGVWLAPHAKTSMSSEITARQLAHGAWGITAATVSQVAVLRSFGVNTILLANLVVDPRSIRWLVRHVLGNPAVEFYCYVDSVESVRLLDGVLSESAAELNVLLEVGFPGGRTGVRNLGQALDVAAAVGASRMLRLCGVSAFEGLTPGFREGPVPGAVSDLLCQVREVVVSLQERDLYANGNPPIVTAGGSSFFDVVVDELGSHRFGFPVRTILRSGCYVTHDHGVYQRTSPMRRQGGVNVQFQPALEVLASVVSRPEPDLMIVGCGRRDVPTDDALPVILGLLDQPSSSVGPGPAESIAINDHHLFVRVDPASTVAAGNVVRLGISHPCGAFDRWRQIPLVDENYRMVGVLEPRL